MMRNIKLYHKHQRMPKTGSLGAIKRHLLFWNIKHCRFCSSIVHTTLSNYLTLKSHFGKRKLKNTSGYRTARTHIIGIVTM